jgi:hypothetical protein
LSGYSNMVSKLMAGSGFKIQQEAILPPVANIGAFSAILSLIIKVLGDSPCANYSSL